VAGVRDDHGARPVDGHVVALGSDARRIRRSGWLVVAAQVAALDLVVVALVGQLGRPGWLLVPAGVLLGVGATAWLRHREIAAVGEPPPPWRLAAVGWGGVLAGGLALTVLAAGASLGVAGVRAAAFGPSLAHLRRADRLGLEPHTLALSTAALGLVVLICGGLLSRQARRLGRVGVARLRHLDPRPPMLYLRSFGDDTLPLASVVSARRPFFELFSVRGREPFEDAVAWELASYGPVVAVGRPGASLASLGAAREHLPDATWQVEVAERLAEARALVVAIGESPGLAWEVGHVVSGGHLDRTMFLFPPLDEAALRARWSSVAAALAVAGRPPIGLPVDAGLVVTAVVEPELVVTVADRRDEASYRAAVDRSMLLLDTTAAPSDVPPPARR
jgi:hypothetical protein